MQHVTLFRTILLTGSCLVIGTIASADPVSTTTTAKKHAQCQGTKVKTACNQREDMRDYLQSREAPPTSDPTVVKDPSAASKLQQVLEPAKDDSGETQPK